MEEFLTNYGERFTDVPQVTLVSVAATHYALAASEFAQIQAKSAEKYVLLRVVHRAALASLEAAWSAACALKSAYTVIHPEFYRQKAIREALKVANIAKKSAMKSVKECARVVPPEETVLQHEIKGRGCVCGDEENVFYKPFCCDYVYHEFCMAQLIIGARDLARDQSQPVNSLIKCPYCRTPWQWENFINDLCKDWEGGSQIRILEERAVGLRENALDARRSLDEAFEEYINVVEENVRVSTELKSVQEELDNQKVSKKHCFFLLYLLLFV